MREVAAIHQFPHRHGFQALANRLLGFFLDPNPVGLKGVNRKVCIARPAFVPVSIIQDHKAVAGLRLYMY